MVDLQERQAAAATAAASPAIHCVELSKHFGRTVALAGLTMTVPRGEVFGFLGPNGAGKTTAVKLLLGLLEPTGGEGWVLGRPLGEVAVRQADQFEHPRALRPPRGAREARQLAVDAQHLAAAEPRLVPEQLGQVADSAADRDLAQRAAEHPALAAGRIDQAQQELDGGRLARAVGPEEPEHLAARHGHREPGERDRAAEVLLELHAVDGRRGGGRRGRRLPFLEVYQILNSLPPRGEGRGGWINLP